MGNITARYNSLKSSKLFAIVHWTSFAVLVLIFLWGASQKILQQPGMIQDMKSLGFNVSWTIAIGVGETIGLTGLILGLKYRRLKTASAIFLFPFAVGAFMVHMAHNDYNGFWAALICSVCSIALLLFDRHFQIRL